MIDHAFADDLFGKPFTVAEPPRLWGVWFESENGEGYWATDESARVILSYDKRACLVYLNANPDHLSVREVGDDGKPKGEMLFGNPVKESDNVPDPPGVVFGGSLLGGESESFPDTSSTEYPLPGFDPLQEDEDTDFLSPSSERPPESPRGIQPLP